MPGDFRVDRRRGENWLRREDQTRCYDSFGSGRHGDTGSFFRLRDVLIDQFIAWFDESVVRRLREAWPEFEIHLRGDSGFGVPTMYEISEQLEVDYTLGMGMNARLKKYSDSLLETAVAQYEATDQPQRPRGCPVHRVLVSSRLVAGPAVGGGQVRGECSRH